MAGFRPGHFFICFTFPGRGAARSGAPLIRDRLKRGACDDPGSGAHHCASLRAAPGTLLGNRKYRSEIGSLTVGVSDDALNPTSAVPSGASALSSLSDAAVDTARLVRAPYMTADPLRSTIRKTRQTDRRLRASPLCRVTRRPRSADSAACRQASARARRGSRGDHGPAFGREFRESGGCLRPADHGNNRAYRSASFKRDAIPEVGTGLDIRPRYSYIRATRSSKGTFRVRPRRWSECGARARSRKPRPGGSGHHSRRYYGRCGRCSPWTGIGEGG